MGGLVKGRAALFSKKCEDLDGPLMESRMSSVTQKDLANEQSVGVRYISDPTVEINERIDPEHAIRCEYINMPM